MATANIGLEEDLWLMADKLRGSMDSSEYKHVDLGLVGVGQEIHISEEVGISQWTEAVTNSDTDWEIYYHLSCKTFLRILKGTLPMVTGWI